MRARVVLTLVVTAVAMGAATTDAPACSCAPVDARRALAQSDAAFVGKLVERPSGPFTNTGQLVPYVFEVEQPVKGELPKRLEVLASASGASCGIEARTGERIGLFLTRQAGTWRSSLCQQVDPAQLLAAARPLPAPNGSGPTALLAGGSFGEARTIALDRTGRTLRYGKGKGETLLLDACPGGTRAVEIARAWPNLSLAVRDLRTMRLVREQPLRLRNQLYPATVDCRTPSGDDILLFATREVGPLGVIFRLTGPRSKELHRGQGIAAVFGARYAYLTTGSRANRLVAVDLERGVTRRLGAVPTGTGALALSPDARHLAAVAYGAPVPNASASRVLALDLRGEAPRLRSTPLRSTNVSGRIGWLSNGTFAFLPSGGNQDALRIYDTRLRLRARLAWPARLGVVRGGVAYGIGGGNEARVLRVTLPGGRARADAKLPGQTVYALEGVPAAAR